MACIIQTFNLPIITEDNGKPILYIDSINVSSYPIEMHRECIKYIRENTDPNTISEGHVFKSESHSVQKEQDIIEKPDGYYYIANNKDNIFIMYKKYTSLGLFYNRSLIEKVFTLTCNQCKKVCPKVFEKSETETNVFNVFTDELKKKVASLRNRIDNMPSISNDFNLETHNNFARYNVILTPAHLKDDISSMTDSNTITITSVSIPIPLVSSPQKDILSNESYSDS